LRAVVPICMVVGSQLDESLHDFDRCFEFLEKGWLEHMWICGYVDMYVHESVYEYVYEYESHKHYV